jgi:hypothetical protein
MHSHIFLNPPRAHSHDAICKRTRILSIVRDVNRRECERLLQAPQFRAEGLAQLRIQAGEGFIQHEQAGLGDEGTRQGDPLLLSAR